MLATLTVIKARPQRNDIPEQSDDASELMALLLPANSCCWGSHCGFAGFHSLLLRGEASRKSPRRLSSLIGELPPALSIFLRYGNVEVH